MYKIFAFLSFFSINVTMRCKWLKEKSQNERNKGRGGGTMNNTQKKKKARGGCVNSVQRTVDGGSSRPESFLFWSAPRSVQLLQLHLSLFFFFFFFFFFSPPGYLSFSSELGRMVGQLRIVSPAVVDDAQGRLSRTDVAAQLLLLLLLLLLLAKNHRVGLMLLQLLQMLAELSSVMHRTGAVVHHVVVAMDRVEIGLVRRRRRRIVLMAIGLQMTCHISNWKLFTFAYSV